MGSPGPDSVAARGFGVDGTRRITLPAAGAPAPGPAIDCLVGRNRHGLYCVPASCLHRPVPQRIMAGEVHEAETIGTITARCGSGDVVHAGAFFGDFLPALSRGVARGATVWAFEPNPESYRCAVATLQLNGIGNVVLATCGLGGRTGCRTLLIKDDDGLPLGGRCRMAPEGAGAADNGVRVPIVTVDEAVGKSRPVSVIHLDVETSELAALSGALGTIRRCRPMLIVEIERRDPLAVDRWLAAKALDRVYQRVLDVRNNAVYVSD